jgi:Domain of unknown function (DUF4832)/Domain of unknown function (DUF4874)
MRLTTIILLLFFLTVAHAQKIIIGYQESMEDFPNPERGFYHSMETTASNYKLLTEDRLKNLRNSQKMKGTTYTVASTLVLREIVLDKFVHSFLTKEFLENVKKDFQIARTAGVKLILRFAYTASVKSGDCPDQYKICPPYGDAPKEIVLQHIAQLKPLLRENADVIDAIQMGFIGIWGENYFTDYFGDASMNGVDRIMDSSWRDRNQILKALLDAVPEDRMIQVRTPQIKQRYVYGVKALVTESPINIKEAYTGMDKARIGFHNDCFLASADDYGTYYDYGNSSSPRKEANEVLRNYFSRDSKFVVVGGETCDDTFSPQNDCEPAGHAEKELREMHYSYLNSGYNNDVNNDWETGGCMDNIKRKLGYRFVLRTGEFSEKVRAGEKLYVHLKLQNIGYASPYNPRPVQLLLRRITGGKIYSFNFKTDIRFWFSGIIDLNGAFVLPSEVTPGKYELLLNLPDKYPTLSARPEYSIRLANENSWEPATGYNSLNYTLLITEKTPKNLR